MKEYYKVKDLFAGKISCGSKTSHQLFIIEKGQEEVEKVSFRNHLLKRNYQHKDCYYEIFTRLLLRQADDDIINYLDLPYVDHVEPITNYLSNNDLNNDMISKYRLLELYSKINSDKEKHLQK